MYRSNSHPAFSVWDRSSSYDDSEAAKISNVNTNINEMSEKSHKIDREIVNTSGN